MGDKAKVNIIFQDRWLIVVNKPVGWTVAPSKNKAPDVHSYLSRQYAHNEPDRPQIHIVHRIDQRVSGLVLFARDKEALRACNDAFSNRKVTKTYWAIVEGKMESKEGKLDQLLHKNSRLNKSFIDDSNHPKAKKAILEYKTIWEMERYTALAVNPLTGRHHQIRCQLASIGNPIKGDLKYGSKRSNKDKSISLHSQKLDLLHPINKNQLSFTAPPPEESLWTQLVSHLS